MSERMKRLAELADMIKDLELARLSESQAQRQMLRTQSEAVRATRAQSVPADVADAAYLCGNAEHWQTWCQHRLADLSAQEARAAADMEVQKKIAARAFGRSSALGQLKLRLSKR